MALTNLTKKILILLAIYWCGCILSVFAVIFLIARLRGDF